MRNFIRINLHHYIARCSIDVHPNVLIVLSCSWFPILTVSTDTVLSRVSFCFRKQIPICSLTRCSLINYLLTWLVRPALGNTGSRTWKYEPGAAKRRPYKLLKAQIMAYILPQPAISSPSRHKRAVCLASVLLPFSLILPSSILHIVQSPAMWHIPPLILSWQPWSFLHHVSISYSSVGFGCCRLRRLSQRKSVIFMHW